MSVGVQLPNGQMSRPISKDLISRKPLGKSLMSTLLCSFSVEAIKSRFYCCCHVVCHVVSHIVVTCTV